MHVDRGMYTQSHVKIAGCQASQLSSPSLRCCRYSSAARGHAEATSAAEAAAAAQGCASGVDASRSRHAYWRARGRRRTDGECVLNGTAHPSETSDGASDGHDRYALVARRCCRWPQRRRYDDRRDVDASRIHRSRTLDATRPLEIATAASAAEACSIARATTAASLARYGLVARRSYRGTRAADGGTQAVRRGLTRLTVRAAR